METGQRIAGADLARRAASPYKLPLTALPLRPTFDPPKVSPDDLQRKLAALGYPGFEHVRPRQASNPAAVAPSAIVKPDLNTRLVEALPWVLSEGPGDLNWDWLRDRVKLQNAQNRLGYLVHLAKDTARGSADRRSAVPALSTWEDELEAARLAREGTLCRDSMPEPERAWLRANRPKVAHHWNLLTNLITDQLAYAAH